MIRAALLFLAYFGIVSIAFDADTTIPVCAKKSSPNDIYFDLSNMGLNAIRRPFVSGPSVTCVNLAGNRITRLEKGAFDGLPELRYLNLAKNPVSFEDFMNMSFPALRELVLDGPFSDNNGYDSYDTRQRHNPLSTYYTNVDYGMTRLEEILPILLPRLEKLSLRNYGKNTVTRWLEYFIVPNLTHLYIAGNSLSESNLPKTYTESLTHLNMDNNKVEMFATNFPKLRYLSINHNKIENVCNHNCNRHSLSLHDMPELEYLSLVGNGITTIESNFFEDSDNLRSLHLGMNKMRYLPRHLFNNMSSLKNLSLDLNELTEIPDLCGLGALEVLTLNGNQISIIDHTSFCNLSNLRSIDLSNNSLTSVTDGTFVQLSGLTILDLSFNNIEALPDNWMGPGHSLDNLNLDGNLFNDVANMSLGLIEDLDTLSIGYNPLRMITIRSLVTLPPNMKIDVSRIYDSKLPR